MRRNRRMSDAAMFEILKKVQKQYDVYLQLADVLSTSESVRDEALPYARDTNFPLGIAMTGR